MLWLGETKKTASQENPLVPERVLTKLTSRVTLAPNARVRPGASFSNPAKTATYAESATRKRRTSSSVTDAMPTSKVSFKYMSVTNNIETRTVVNLYFRSFMDIIINYGNEVMPEEETPHHLKS